MCLQYHLRRASLTEESAFAFLKVDSQGDYITYSGFCEALRQVCSIGYYFSLQYIILYSIFQTTNFMHYPLHSYSSIWSAVMDWVTRRYRNCGYRQTLMQMVLLTIKNLRYPFVLFPLFFPFSKYFYASVVLCKSSAFLNNINCFTKSYY